VLNTALALDLMSDALYGGRKFRTLSLSDEGHREGLAIDLAFSLPSSRVIRVLVELVTVHGRPQAVRVANGPEQFSEAFVERCAARSVEVRYIQPGKPDQSAYIERFHRSYRRDVLGADVFGSFDEVIAITEEWLENHNGERPHDSLGRAPPRTLLTRPNQSRESSVELST